MRITLVNTSDVVGGAERCSYDLARELRAAGHDATLVVGRKLGNDPFVVELRAPAGDLALRRFCVEQLGLTETVLASPVSACRSRPEFRAEVCNIHNMHGGYWNIWALPLLARRAPLVLTLHDEWLLTGDCGYSYECDRWLAGCGRCPQARWPDPSERYAVGGRDATRLNLWLKRRCLGTLSASAVTVVAPSRWLLDRARRTPHLSRFPLVQIEYGVDLDVFRPPEDARRARVELGLPVDDFLLFTAATDLAHSRKNFQALAELAASSVWPRRCALVCAGSLEPAARAELAHLPILLLGRLSDRRTLARALGACDATVLAPLADNFPYVALESLACGRPVLASRVGGIPEIIEDGVTGWLVPSQAAAWDLGQALGRVVRLPAASLESMQRAARAEAERRFSLSRFRDAYLRLFSDCAA